MGGNLGKALSTLQKKGDGDAGAVAPLEDPPTPPETDPRLPLTARQLFSITKSWKGIARAMEPTGITMFVRRAGDRRIDKSDNCGPLVFEVPDQTHWRSWS
ncbi:neuroglobin [Trichonephila clavipes]|nr:neuroglobin [Trichonephila clavipes]